MALKTQVKRLNPLQQQERTVRRKRGAGIAQSLNARFENEGERSKCFSVGKAMVRGIGLGELLEAAGGGPVELARIDDDAADGGAMATEELGCRIDDDVRSPLDRADQGRGGGGVVDNQRKAVFVGNGGKLLDVGDVELGIAESFGVDSAGLGD